MFSKFLVKSFRFYQDGLLLLPCPAYALVCPSYKRGSLSIKKKTSKKKQFI